MTTGLAEPKAQRWRVMGYQETGRPYLLCLASSIKRAREQYVEVWDELIDKSIREKTVEIRVQQWIGDPDRGYWQNHALLPIPKDRQAA